MNIFLKKSPLFLLFCVLVGCASVAPKNAAREALAPLALCPDKPNCVSSESAGDHFIEPIKLGQNVDLDWLVLRVQADEIKRSTVLQQSDDYLHVQVSSFSRLFKDDLELRLLREKKLVHIRSASRVGYSDFGVNRKRVEALRQAFMAAKQPAQAR